MKIEMPFNAGDLVYIIRFCSCQKPSNRQTRQSCQYKTPIDGVNGYKAMHCAYVAQTAFNPAKHLFEVGKTVFGTESEAKSKIEQLSSSEEPVRERLPEPVSRVQKGV